LKVSNAVYLLRLSQLKPNSLNFHYYKKKGYNRFSIVVIKMSIICLCFPSLNIFVSSLFSKNFIKTEITLQIPKLIMLIKHNG